MRCRPGANRNAPYCVPLVISHFFVDGDQDTKDAIEARQQDGNRMKNVSGSPRDCRPLFKLRHGAIQLGGISAVTVLPLAKQRIRIYLIYCNYTLLHTLV